jgi:hypothetical protein
VSSFNNFLRSINKPVLGNPIEPTLDQEQRLKNIEQKLNIERTRIEKLEPEERDDGTEV